MSDRIVPATAGIHHVTALASFAQRTFEFHSGILGLRVVKRTVNFDDPGSWHLYFGNETGAPGTLLTLFPHEGLAPGRAGAGQFTRVAFAVPLSSFAFWIERLLTRGVPLQGPSLRFGERVLTVRDPDGLTYDLVGADYANDLPGWAGGPVPADAAIRGVHGVTLHERESSDTAALLAECFGYASAQSEGDTTRYLSAAPPGLGRVVELRRTAASERGASGAGTVHHVAFRATDGVVQAAVRAAIAERGFPVTEVVDRQYFRSIYFRTPDGALFEVATDGPGMLVDEDRESLGTTLQLPPLYEASRDAIAKGLPALEPGGRA